MCTPRRAFLRQLAPRQPSRELEVAGHSTDQLVMAIKRPTSSPARYVPFY